MNRRSFFKKTATACALVGLAPKLAFAAKPAAWRPSLSPTQLEIYNDPSGTVLIFGEPATGKSIACAHKLVRHAWENENAFVVIVTQSMRAGTEGIWRDIDSLVLPEWREGVGLKYEKSKLDPLTKDRHRLIRNKHGSWSKVLVVSIPNASQVANRTKGMSPSMVYADDMDCDNSDARREYIAHFTKQLGRRRGVKGPQQFVASSGGGMPLEDFAMSFRNNYSFHYIPIHENEKNLPPGYRQTLKEISADPGYIEGYWTDTRRFRFRSGEYSAALQAAIKGKIA